ncbi:MAG TPA: PAS domain S-box protein [Verrucomicrobiae bacterium]|nr:PAS domain S-box protein [Verrucomicrobiae bacterium]
MEEQQRDQRALQERARHQQALYQLTDALTRAASLTEVFDSALDSVLSSLPCDRAALLLVNEHEVMQFKAWRGLSDVYRQAAEGHSPWKPGQESPRLVCVENVASTPLPEPLRDAIDHEGIRALAFLPLLSHGRLLGKLMVSYNSPHTFSPDELQLAQAIANQAAFGIERKQGEDVTRRLAAIVEYSDDAIISKDLNGIIVSWNRGAERLFGYTVQEAVGQHISLVIPPERLGEEPGIIEHIRHGELVEHYETVRRHKDGSLLDISLTVSPLRNEKGEVVGASKIARDITERKRAERMVREAQAQLLRHAANLEKTVLERTADLRASNEQLEAFVYSIAHDLRGPLRSMEGFSAMLLEEAGAALGEQGRNYANRINRSAQFMDQLLTDLLAFSQLNQQRIALAPADLSRAVQGALSLLENEIHEKRAQVDGSGPWPSVLAHPPTLGQVLYNLLSNALKFVAPGVQPVVRLRAEVCAATNPPPSLRKERGPSDPDCSEDWVRIWVEDNGIGIAPEHQEQIFRLFTRLEGEKYSGTGIGLAIVQKGTERMNGRVGVQSRPGQGSRFWIELKKA